MSSILITHTHTHTHTHTQNLQKNIRKVSEIIKLINV